MLVQAGLCRTWSEIQIVGFLTHRLTLCFGICKKPVFSDVVEIMSLLFPSDESATIRVTNLSEDTRESDLQELFRPFGPIQRIYLAKDKNTGQSKVSIRVIDLTTPLLIV